MSNRMSDFFRYGWPRWYLIRLHGWLPTERANDWLLDFLYPNDMTVTFK